MLAAVALVLGLGLSAGVALILGVAVALTVGNPWPTRTPKLAHRLLTLSVIALGAGMNLHVIARVGASGVGYTAAGIALALTLGALLGRWLSVERDTSLLLSVGTAICGGSAIAAVAAVIGAKARDVSTAIIVVFLLNGVALFAFPAIGHALHLPQRSFGLWSALAIHDTSSVVGAAAAYGREALGVATAAKLARALWIAPVAVLMSFVHARGTPVAVGALVKRLWFIAAFLLAAALTTYVPALQAGGKTVAAVAHRVLAVTLLLVGLGLTRHGLRELGVRALGLALVLWIALAAGGLAALEAGLVR